MKKLSQHDFKTEDILAFLEEKIHNDDYTDIEYDLYIDFRDYGRKVFKEPKNIEILKKIKQEILLYLAGRL